MRRSGLLAIAILLSGCASIPSVGPVVQGPRVDVLRNDGYVRVIARPPVPGMTPDALVLGFLTASASVADGDDTALQYLTSAAAAAWNRRDTTVVYDAAALTLTSVRDDVVRINAPKVGVIGSGYRYEAAEAGATVAEEFQLQRIDGEWRIASVPPALYLSEGDITRSFRSYPIFFFDPEFERLVPEYVMVPIGTGNRATQLLQVLLAGPDPAYGNALASALPTRTEARNATVLVNGVTAVVDIPGARMPVSEAKREAMLAQVVWTMWQLSEVVLVSLSIDGQLVEWGDRTLFSSGDFAAFDPEESPQPAVLAYVDRERLITQSAGERRSIDYAGPLSAGAASRDGQLFAAINIDRTLLQLSSSGARPVPIATGSDLAKPEFVPEGRLWFVDREVQGGLRLWDSSSGVRRVIVGLPAGSRILDFAIASDRRRIALIVSDGVTTTLHVGVIQYTDAGAKIVGLNRVERRLTSLTAVAWDSMRSLVVLGSAGAVGVQPIRVSLPVGGMTLLGGPANGVTITSTAGEPIIVGDQAGQLWEFRDNRWSAGVLGTAPQYVV